MELEDAATFHNFTEYVFNDHVILYRNFTPNVQYPIVKLWSSIENC